MHVFILGGVRALNCIRLNPHRPQNNWTVVARLRSHTQDLPACMEGGWIDRTQQVRWQLLRRDKSNCHLIRCVDRSACGVRGVDEGGGSAFYVNPLEWTSRFDSDLTWELNIIWGNLFQIYCVCGECLHSWSRHKRPYAVIVVVVDHQWFHRLISRAGVYAKWKRTYLRRRPVEMVKLTENSEYGKGYLRTYSHS